MTTTTRTTRKAPWVVVLTALLAVLGMVFGAMATATTAVADPDPTQVCAPLDSGKIDTTGDPGSVTITAPEGKLITGYCVKAGSTQQGDGPVYVPVNPPVSSLVISYPGGKAISNYSYSLGDAPVYYYTPSATASERVCTLVDDVWTPDFLFSATVTGTLLTKSTPWTDEEKAAEDAKLQTDANSALLNEESDFTVDRTGESCQGVESYKYTPSAKASATACTLVEGTWTADYPFNVTVTGEELSKTTPWTDEEKASADAALQSTADQWLTALMGDATIDETGASCQSTPTLYAGVATYPTVQVCVGPDVVTVGPISGPYSTATIYTTQAEANAAAAAFVSGDITGKTVAFMAAHPEYAPVPESGICTPPVVEAATVAVPEPATVAVPEPATVPVPTAVTLPATVPAGDGSTAPTIPAYALALLVLGATALAVTAVRLVRTTR